MITQKEVVELWFKEFRATYKYYLNPADIKLVVISLDGHDIIKTVNLAKEFHNNPNSRVIHTRFNDDILFLICLNQPELSVDPKPDYFF